MHGWIILECTNSSVIVPDMQEVETSYRLWMKSMLVHYILFTTVYTLNTQKYTKELPRMSLKLSKEDRIQYDDLVASG